MYDKIVFFKIYKNPNFKNISKIYCYVKNSEKFQVKISSKPHNQIIIIPN